MIGDNHKQKTSVARFLFMPQFNLSFRHMSHIIPIFMRTLALMFAQAGLIDENHPSTRYGMAGVKKYGLPALMGEAWFTLRTTPASGYQWSLFAGVMLMMATVASSILITIATVFLGIGTTVQAQLFSLDAGATNFGAVPTSGGAQGLFDKRIYALGGGNGTVSDYGIMVLDKMLRQGMLGQGGALQNGLGAMFEIYNTGVLMVAAVMLFWAILSVVVDTAKTGIVGGQRHNMVWAPIRVVFALGLLVPLGNGFSSGQFLVVKLAEFGSNLGSNAWLAYIDNVISNANLVFPDTIANPTQLVYRFTNMWLCRVSHNTLTWMAARDDADAIDPAQIVATRMIGGTAGSLDPGASEWGFAFTNESTGNLCGSVLIPAFANDQKLRSALLAGNEAFGVQGTGQDPVAAAAAVFKIGMIISQARSVVDVDFGALSGGIGPPQPVDALRWHVDAKDFACDFAAQHLRPAEGSTTNPVVDSGVCAGAGPSFGPAATLGRCGGSTDVNVIQYPSRLCIENMITTYATDVQASMNQATSLIQLALNLFWTSGNANSPVNRGWADMGSWFTRIGMLNAAVQDMKTPQIAIIGGDLVSKVNKVKQDAEAKDPGFLKKNLSELEIRMLEINNKYEDWWQVYANVAIGAQVPINNGVPVDQVTGGPIGGAQPLTEQSPAGPDSIGFLDRIRTKYAFQNVANQDPEAVLGRITQKISMQWAPLFMDIVQPDDPTVYPFAEISKIGGTIISVAIVGMLGMAGIAMSMDSSGGNLATGFFLPAIGSVLTTVAGSMLMAGMLLTYYVPMLPLLRVAFAVMTWMISVFEAVVMVPIAALAHISTEGDGLAGAAKGAWVLWLNVLLRPVLTVLGFVGALMVFNTFVVYFHAVFKDAVMVNFSTTGMTGIFTTIFMTLLYVGTIYVIANSCFKMLEVIPNALMRWMPGGQIDQSFDDNNLVSNLVNTGGHMMSGMTRGIQFQGLARNSKEGAGATKGGDADG